jgi:DNA-binding CsgD family transcriptional regulator
MQMGVSLVSNIVDYACLSHREKELFSYVLEGYPSKVIAQHLGVTEALARVQLERFLRKIRVENRTQATVWALANLPELDKRPASADLIALSAK